MVWSTWLVVEVAVLLFSTAALFDISLASRNGLVEIALDGSTGDICEPILLRKGLFDISGDAPRSVLLGQYETLLNGGQGDNTEARTRWCHWLY